MFVCCSDLPPSQGGKYSGFGSTVQKPETEEGEFLSSAWSSLSSGWSSFSSNASTWASTAGDKASTWASHAGEKATQLKATLQENVVKPSTEQVSTRSSCYLNVDLGWDKLTAGANIEHMRMDRVRVSLGPRAARAHTRQGLQ